MTAKLISVLLLDDDARVRRCFERYLRRANCKVVTAASMAEGREALNDNVVDLALVDFQLPDGTGVDFSRWASETHHTPNIYCMSGYANVAMAVEAMQAGCVDVLEKPFDFSKLDEILAALRNDHCQDELASWRSSCADDIVGESDALLHALGIVKSVADTDCTVLVTGESGTGKELVARAVHRASSRRNAPFIALNCAAIPESMIEAELFGHAKGAFTGASQTRLGRIAAAAGGTLFLDEIGDMPLAAQAKLLRTLQDRTILPVGADQPVHVDVRIVAATNKDLQAMVLAGTFRGDLFFRLNVIPVGLPALRERGEDILALAHKFLEEANERNHRHVSGFDNLAQTAMLAHAWPGNVRELCNLVERAVLLNGSGIITAADLCLTPRTCARGSSAGISLTPDNLELRRALDQVERQLIGEALERTNGNRTQAAALLGLNRTTLVEKIRKHAS